MSIHQVVFITGATGGIGFALARLYRDRGYRVVLAGRSEEKLERSLAALGGPTRDLRSVVLDVCDPASIAAAHEWALDQLGSIDVLINNAGVAISAPVAKGEGLAQKHMDVNFHGPRRMLEVVLPGMVERGTGRVFQVASSAGLQGYAYTSAYCASKHALIGYTRAAALELQSKGIHFHMICPHFVDSPMTDASVARIQETTGKEEGEARMVLAAMNPDGVLVPPTQIAELCLRLMDGVSTGDIWELTGTKLHVRDAGYTGTPS